MWARKRVNFMKRVITLEFHLDSVMPADVFLRRVALACFNDGLLQPTDVVRIPDEGIGYEVKPTSDTDWRAIEAKLDALFVKDCDTYKVGAAALFNKSVDQVTKGERQLVKLVFLRAFRVRGPAWVQSAFEYADHVINALRARGQFDEIDKAVTATMRIEDAEREDAQR